MHTGTRPDARHMRCVVGRTPELLGYLISEFLSHCISLRLGDNSISI